MEFFNQMVNQLREIFRDMPASKRIFVALMLLGSLAGMGWLIYEARTPEYVTLFYDLADGDAAKIDAAIREMNVTPRWNADSTRVSVPSSHRDEIRMALANKGLPNGGSVGLDIMTDTGPFASNEVLQMTKMRAIQGELARSIMHIDQIKAARVMLALPDPEPFLRDKKDPSASVVVRLEEGGYISQANVRSIVKLVSHAVVGMKPENVTVVDSTGRLLSGELQSERPSASDLQAEIKRDFEENLQQKLQTQLDDALGKSRAVVRVSAELDFTETQITQETYSPDESTTLTKKVAQEPVFRGGSPMASSQEGSSDTQAQTSSRISGLSAPAMKVVKEATYAQSRTQTVTRKAPGKVARVSVSALVDSNNKVVTEDEDGNKSIQYEERTAEEQRALEDKIKATLTAAANLNLEKDPPDQVQVRSMPFAIDEPEFDQLATASLQATRFSSQFQFIIKWTIVALLGLLFFFFVLRPLVQTLSHPVRVTASTAGGGAMALDGGESSDAHRLLQEAMPEGNIREAMEKGASPDEIARMLAQHSKPDQSASRMLREELSNMARTNPHQAAGVIKKWLES